MSDLEPNAQAQLAARCCATCGRLPRWCTHVGLADGPSLRQRVEAIREEAAAERRARLERRNDWDREHRDRRWFAVRAVCGEQEELQL